MTTPTFYVFHGDDEFSRKAAIAEMQAAMNDPSQINTILLDGTQVSPMAAINAVCAIPFLADKRLVIVEGMLSHLAKRKSDLAILVEELPKLPAFARLVFSEDKQISDSNLVLRLAQDKKSGGYVKDFTAPKKGALTQWIIQQAKQEHGVDIEPAAATALMSVVDEDLRRADSELAKLAAYVNYQRRITEQDVATLTPYVAEANIFEMVDAIGQRDAQTAMTLTQNLLNEGNEPLSLLGMINRQFRLLVLAREYIDETGGISSLADAIKVHPFVAQKLGSQARQFADIEQLESIYKKLAELDFRIKTGQIPADMALQLFIAGVAK